MIKTSAIYCPKIDSLHIPIESNTPVSWTRDLAHIVRIRESIATLTISTTNKIVDISSDNRFKEDAAFSYSSLSAKTENPFQSTSVISFTLEIILPMFCGSPTDTINSLNP